MHRQIEAARWDWMESWLDDNDYDDDRLCASNIDITNINLQVVYGLDKTCDIDALNPHSNRKYNVACVHSLGQKKWLADIGEGKNKRVSRGADTKGISSSNCDRGGVKRRTSVFAEEHDGDALESNVSIPNKRARKWIKKGLSNLGNTCYMNATLQIWYHNLALRKILYSLPLLRDVEADKPLFELQKLFANLQLSSESFVDTAPLLESLRLSRDDQQDVQEFFLLFLAMLEKKVEAIDRDPRVRNQSVNRLRQLFSGNMSNFITCLTCHRFSENRMPFYALEVPINDFNWSDDVPADKSTYDPSTLEYAIQQLLISERLDGDNRYNCEDCGSKQDAERRTTIRSLPPVLHLQIMRFVYDPIIGEKRKVFTKLDFPDVLDMSNLIPELDKGQVYDLVAVAMHKGPTAYEGHYTAHVLDQENHTWYNFNDDVAVRMDGQEKRGADTNIEGLGQECETIDQKTGKRTSTKKRRKSIQQTHNERDERGSGRDVIIPGRYSTTNAYMFCYRRRDAYNMTVAPEVPERVAQELQDDLDKERIAIETDQRAQQESEHQSEQKARLNRKFIEMLDKSFMSGVEKPETADSEFLSTKWLTNGLKRSFFDCGPVDNTDIVCEHNLLSPLNLASYRRVNKKFASKIFEMSQGAGGPRLGMQSLCVECVRRVAWNKVLSARIRNDHERVTKLLEEDKERSSAEQATATRVLCSIAGFKTWMKNSRGDSPSPLDDDFVLNDDIVCTHGRLLPQCDTPKVLPIEVWNLMTKHVRESRRLDSPATPCSLCIQNAQMRSDEALAQRMLDSHIAGHLLGKTFTVNDLAMPSSSTANPNTDSSERPFNRSVLYVVPHAFLRQWKAFFGDKNGARPRPFCVGSETLLCDHRRLPFRVHRPERANQVPTSTNLTKIGLIDDAAFRGLAATYGDVEAIALRLSSENEIVSQPPLCEQCEAKSLSGKAEAAFKYSKGIIKIKRLDDDEDPGGSTGEYVTRVRTKLMYVRVG